MVGDSLAHDIDGALQLGMRAVLVSPCRRPGRLPTRGPGRSGRCAICRGFSRGTGGLGAGRSLKRCALM